MKKIILNTSLVIAFVASSFIGFSANNENKTIANRNYVQIENEYNEIMPETWINLLNEAPWRITFKLTRDEWGCVNGFELCIGRGC